MQRLDFYQRLRAWEAETLRSAPALAYEMPEDEEGEEEEDVLPVSSWAGSAMQVSQPLPPLSQPEEDEVDALLAREDEELAALLEFLPREDGMGEVEPGSEHAWSDGEDYDALFSELMERENGGDPGQQSAMDAELGDAMDTS